jgi:hypothetical protein
MAVAFHPSDSQHFLSCTWNGKVRLQRVEPPEVIAWKQTQSGLEPLPVHCATFSYKGDQVFVGAMFGRVRHFLLPPSLKLEYHAELGALSK